MMDRIIIIIILITAINSEEEKGRSETFPRVAKAAELVVQDPISRYVCIGIIVDLL